jgi:hypothetical protein
MEESFWKQVTLFTPQCISHCGLIFDVTWTRSEQFAAPAA